VRRQNVPPLWFLSAELIKGAKMSQLWIPNTRKDLIRSLSSVYRGEEDKFLKMPKKQLLAIFFYLRRTKGMFS
jgi:hypothetical protein